MNTGAAEKSLHLLRFDLPVYRQKLPNIEVQVYLISIPVLHCKYKNF